MKKLLVYLLILAYIFTLGALRATADGTDNSVEYQGGIVARGSGSRLFALLTLRDQLDMAYVQLDRGYLTAGTPATWTVTVSGGSGLYLYTYGLYYRAGNTGSLRLSARQEKSNLNTFTCTPAYDSGQYLLQVTVYDSAGAYLTWQSQVYEATRAGQDADPSTVPGKVKQIADECMQKAGSSDYARALWLHDWLIHNADYDMTDTYFFADGVLLHGAGVCQSYALAYEMLLRAVGIESIYVTGDVIVGEKTESHAWNLVKLNGKWYHVDCTWDDPVGGGETRVYFGLTDELMAKDHLWAGRGGVVPACESADASCLLNALGEIADSRAEAEAILAEAVSGKREYVVLLFPGAEESLSEIANAYLNGARFANCVNGYRVTVRMVSDYQCAECLIDYGSGFPDLSVAQTVYLEPGPLRVGAGDTYRLTALVSPEGTGGLEWISEDPSVVRVSGGALTAIRPGVTRIDAMCANGASSSVTVYVTGGTRLTVTGCVSVIESEAFANSALLESVTVQDGVTRIESRAFADCPLLWEAHLPGSVEYVAPDALPDNPGLTVYCEKGSAAEAFAKANGFETKYESR